MLRNMCITAVHANWKTRWYLSPLSTPSPQHTRRDSLLLLCVKKGCCEVCVVKCHAGHDLIEAKRWSDAFYCDCPFTPQAHCVFAEKVKSFV